MSNSFKLDWMLLAVFLVLLVVPFPRAMKAKSKSISNQAMFPSFNGATGWLNAQKISARELQGKVVLVQFWTYTCVNWSRTLPYVRAWEAKYKDDGLVLIGVHTPEFTFEHDTENVKLAIKQMNIVYPVAQDNNFAVWNEFENHYWPAIYLIDGNGKIRYHHFGEGSYDETETTIKQLLKENGASKVADGYVDVEAMGIETAADWNNLRSVENFLGCERTERFASPGGINFDKPRRYTIPRSLSVEQWALSGNWTIGKEEVSSNEAATRIVYHFHARDLNLVMKPPKPGSPVRFRVRINGEDPGKSHGSDIDSQGNGTITEPRVYQLIRQSGEVNDAEFEIEFYDVGVQIFDFTFG